MNVTEFKRLIREAKEKGRLQGAKKMKEAAAKEAGRGTCWCDRTAGDKGKIRRYNDHYPECPVAKERAIRALDPKKVLEGKLYL